MMSVIIFYYILSWILGRDAQMTRIEKENTFPKKLLLYDN